MSVKESVLNLYDALERIAQEHEELYDTDVREYLSETLNYYFTWGMPHETLPTDYGLFSAAGNTSVADAVNSFLNDISGNAEAEGLNLGQDRHAVLQDESVITTKGGQTYDTFIGHVDTPPNAEELSPVRFGETAVVESEPRSQSKAFLAVAGILLTIFVTIMILVLIACL